MTARLGCLGLLAAAAALTAPTGALAATEPSEQCGPLAAVIADGYVGSTYVRLRSESDSSHRWLCYRVTAGGTTKGGKVTVTGPTATAAAPSVDGNWQSCTTTAGNAFPVDRHPLLTGSVGGASLDIDAFANGGQAWICLGTGGDGRRVVVPLPSATLPQVTLDQDSAAVPLQGFDPVNPSYPSSSCQLSGDGTRVLGTNVAGGNYWAYARQAGPTRVELCFRAEGQLPQRGGRLTIDAGAVQVQPTVEPGSDLTGCTVLQASLGSGSDNLRVYTSPGASPVSVCVETPAGTHRLTVGASESVVLPTVTWSNDPDTPAAP